MHNVTVITNIMMTVIITLAIIGIIKRKRLLHFTEQVGLFLTAARNGPLTMAAASPIVNAAINTTSAAATQHRLTLMLK